MKSTGGSEPLDWDRVATTPADVLALRHLRQARPLGTAELFRALAQFAPPREMLRERRGPRGPAPFRL
jgi:hypothetical protein